MGNDPTPEQKRQLAAFRRGSFENRWAQLTDATRNANDGTYGTRDPKLHTLHNVQHFHDKCARLGFIR